MASAETIQTVARLIGWYQAMGVDAVVGAEAIDWSGRTGPGIAYRAAFAGQARVDAAPAAKSHSVPQPAALPARAQDGPRTAPIVARQTVAPAARPVTQSQPPVAAVSGAKAAAGQVRSLLQLGEQIEAFEGCGLKRTASRACFYRGAETAKLMIVGEAPGREEDLAGKPFVGPAGQLLDRMLTAAGIDPETTHITNMVYWRPPGNRTPTPEEMEVCLPFLMRQLELVGPDIVLVLGAAAAKGLLGIEEGITRARGNWRDFALSGGRTVRAMATLHPAYLLRTPAAKRHAWRDVLMVKKALQPS